MELWTGLALLGLLHGLNPAMGWLMAAARGWWEGHWRGVAQALPPIGLGHLAGVALSLLPLLALNLLLPQEWVLGPVGLALVGLGLLRWRRARHPRVRSQAGGKELFLWSGLLAFGHGAGAMLLPLCLSGPPLPLFGLEAVLFHSLVAFAATGAAAFLVFRLGAEVIPRLWPNHERIWALALAGMGFFSLAKGLSA
ncbi:hypothetical protein [Thermus thermamylovorans]|uniref:HupE/UreJ family protein n=1 Tax=Thermus thermamylovorans TaxID=2509362 RepID=A0A4Q9B5J7_9DEIN|nr:hypothetical protein [Thermus thermamylovorans]TBH20945.1 hypothetical protein ETP66_03990 [Thermus thermamylovorans]